MLSKLNIAYETQFFLQHKSFDFKLKNTKILIEVNGDYWHGNPSFYNEDDVLNYPGGKVVVRDLWEKDKIKKERAEKYNYKLVYIWENEIVKKSDDEICNLLLERIKN